MRIDGHTEIIAHIGYPTHTFKSPMIYNPYFERDGINALVTPMACKAEDFRAVLPQLFKLANLRGALITMPHKVAVVDLLDVVTPAVRIAGACNAVRRLPDGRLSGDQFDGEGFVRGIRRKGFAVAGAQSLVVGCGGVGCAIAAALAAAGVGVLRLFDVQEASARALAQRLKQHYPAVEVRVTGNDPQGCDLVVNATPLGMNDTDPLPFDVERLGRGTFVGDVVMKSEVTPLLRAARERGCEVQVGTDMLFEMIPAYLEFFELPTTTPERLRSLAQLSY